MGCAPSRPRLPPPPPRPARPLRRCRMPNGPCRRHSCSAPPPVGWSPTKDPLRHVIDAVRYLVRSGCAWRLLPHDFPPPGTVSWWVAKWAAVGTPGPHHDVLRERVRVQAGRAPTPTAAIVDYQSVRAAATVPRASRGWDAGKRVNGRKRHLQVTPSGCCFRSS
jgi:transposase